MSLSKLALLGTARAGDAVRTGTAIDGLVEAATLSPERRILLAAGALAVYRRAGYRPRAEMTSPTPPAPAESKPVCPPGAAAAIRDMLVEYRFELLPEAFEALARAGRRLPPSLLVDVLDLDDAVVRAPARAVMGERGRWLAAQQPSWSWAREPEQAPTVELRRSWEEGRRAERLDAIRGLRDIDPDRARDWIAEVWKSEPSELRQELVAALSTRLTSADEGWLAVAVKDRTRAVRATAAALLARIAGSPVAVRAVARADPLLAWSRKEGGRLDVSPPAAFDPEWEADGLVPRPPRGVGERAWWLMQALSLVPPGHWEQRCPAAPDSIAMAVVRSEWALPLSEGLAHAAAQHDAGAWSVALWDAWVAAPPPLAAADERAAGELLARLYANMPRADAEPRVPALIDAAPRRAIDLEAALARFAPPWSEPVGRAVLDAIEASLAAHDSAAAARLPPLLRFAGVAMPAPLLDRAAALASAPGTARSLRVFDLFARQVALRARLHQEIRS